MTQVTVRLPRLHAGQSRVSAHPARYRVVMCGRRWGKTVYGTTEVAKLALAGQPVAWFAPTYKYAMDVWGDLTRRLAPVIARSNATERRIELLGGGTIDVWTLDVPDPGRGRKYALVVVDEAGIVANLLDQWEQAIRPTLTDLRGRALFLGTPKGRKQGFVALFAKGEADGTEWASFRAPTSDNPHIPADEIDAARRDLPPAVFAQEYEGVPADDGSAPFPASLIAQATAPEPLAQRAGLPGATPVAWGWDFARYQDWTVGIALDATGRVVRAERWQGVPWHVTADRVAQHMGTVPGYGDSTGVGDPVVEAIQRKGAGLDRFDFSRKSKQALMERLHGALAGGDVTLPADVRWLASELETLEWEHTASGIRYAAAPGCHDDAVMALALAVYAYDRMGGAALAPSSAVRYDAPQRHDPNDWTTYVRIEDESGAVLVGGLL